MSNEEFNTSDRLAGDIQQGLGEVIDLTGPLTDAPEMIAARGRRALTSIYAECILAIDDVPKVFGRPEIGYKDENVHNVLDLGIILAAGSYRARIGKLALAKDAKSLLYTVDHAIELDPLYDLGEYRTGQFSLDYWRREDPPRGYLTDSSAEEKLAERSLAALLNSVEAGFSKRLPGVKSWHEYTPEQIVQTMRLNGTIDVPTSEMLKKIRHSGGYSNREYVLGLVDLAQDTNRVRVINQESEAKQAKKQELAERRTRRLRKEVVSSSAAVGMIVSEGATLLLGDKPSLPLIFAGASGGIVVGKKISNRFR